MHTYIILHIPHAGTDMPDEYLGDILIPKSALRVEARREADLFAGHLFRCDGITTVQPSFSRLVCDVERFKDDWNEPESGRGRGLFYTHLENGREFRAADCEARRKVLNDLYEPHHNTFTALVDATIGEYGKCQVIDCHSFTDKPGYPDFCIGADDFHTPIALVRHFLATITTAGYSVRVNFPYSGSIVPMKQYKKDQRARSVMIEVNKRIYMDQISFTKLPAFDNVRHLCQCLIALAGNDAP